MRELNWAGNIEYGAARLYHPKSLEEVSDIVTGSPQVRALGTRHSFNEIADTSGSLIVLDELEGEIEVDASGRRVSVPAGIRYGDLVRHLEREGLALGNLASLPHISIAGAVATGTHGSGDRNPTLSAAVAEVEIVTGQGEFRTLARGDSDFEGAVVGVGMLGIVTGLTLDVVEPFTMRQDIYRGIRWARLLEDFDAITGAGYSVSITPDWVGDDSTIRVKTLNADAPDEVSGAPRVTSGLPVAEGATDRMGVHGPWYDRLPHFRLEFEPSYGREVQSEYLLPRDQAPAALDALRTAMGLSFTAAVLYSAEVRTVAADSLWLSPAYGVETVGIHFTWKLELKAVMALIPRIEATLAPFQARPHWGKLFEMNAPEIAPLFPRMTDFLDLRARLDPERRFVNPWSERVFGLRARE